MKNLLIISFSFLFFTGCASNQAIKKDDVFATMSDPLDQLLFNEKIIDANYRFYDLKDYLTDPIFLKAVNNYYRDLPKDISVGHSLDSVDFSRNHFFLRHSIDSEKYNGPIKINNRALLKQIFVEEQCKGLFANSTAIKKKGGMFITQTYYFVNEKYRVVVDMNTRECKE
ncbi:hypothetical protein GPS59_10135 [Acinetobacter haemolyticus]|uniref:hypothetical protein n=1 Tax=Acinetobacter haemolyticus TaxID=29430 RepID=UPI001372770B|nr:hypothetical protein [Acinetobacter haemolyticus]NAR50099.1 hypothetical protein [Acinetobacter haemolyticus]NAR54361.1 hypothetical protein [Acinetobacter haemolyticus]